MLPNIFGQRTKKRTMKVSEAFDYLIQEEEQRLIDVESVNRIAVERVEQSGIVFLDEIDKIAGREGGHGPDVSREGVQRDILPIIEGTTVNTRYGMVRTDHILFIAAGAFHVSKPSDLIPELQGRFPIRVELQSLTEEDFIRILTEPKSSLVKQYTALLETEGLKLEFTKEALDEIASFAFRVNESTENIGARRLHTIMERVLDEVSFAAPDISKSGVSTPVSSTPSSATEFPSAPACPVGTLPVRRRAISRDHPRHRRSGQRRNLRPQRLHSKRLHSKRLLRQRLFFARSRQIRVPPPRLHPPRPAATPAGRAHHALRKRNRRPH